MIENELFYMGKTTMTLEYAISKIDTYEEFEEQFTDDFLDDDKQVCYYLAELVRAYDVICTEASVKAGYSPAYLGKIINGVKNNPSRNVLLAMCLAIGTTVEEVQKLLKYAGHAPLYVRRKRDVMIWFGFMKHLSPDDVDELLQARGYAPVTGIAKK